jgi:transketolase
MHVLAPCDSLETERATLFSLLDLVGPAYIRFAREATPVVTTPATPFRYEVANIIRYRSEKPHFLDAFETFLSANYAGEDEDVSIIACGPMVAEAMRAAWLLREEFGLETRVVNVHTLKPLDVGALVQAADQTRLIITAEEHQVGGLGNIVAGAMLRHRKNYKHPLLFDMVGVNDRFGVSGKPWELVQEFGLSAEHIAARVLQLRERLQGHEERASVA